MEHRQHEDIVMLNAILDYLNTHDTKRVTSPPPYEVRWIRRGIVWELSEKQA